MRGMWRVTHKAYQGGSKEFKLQGWITKEEGELEYKLTSGMILGADEEMPDWLQEGR